MIKIFILDNEPIYKALITASELICYENEELHLMAEPKMPAEGLPRDYDIYSLHLSLVRPIEEHLITANSDNCAILQQNSLDGKFCSIHDAIKRIYRNLRINTPNSYILIRNTIECLDNISGNCRNSADKWCSGFISDSFTRVLKEIVEKRKIK